MQFLDQIWKSAATSVSAMFFGRTTLMIFAENWWNFLVGIFFQKSVLGNPDSNLSKF